MDTPAAGAERAPAAAPIAPIRHCRNCGAIAPGAYCSNCGQETRVRLPTFREFMREATGRLVGFDGKLWRTLGALFFRPGLLTREYLAGRRRRYIRPARLFLVASLLLFAVLRIAAELSGTEILQFENDPPKPAPAAKGAPSKEAEPGPDIGVIAVGKDDINFKVENLPEYLAPLTRRIEHFNALPRAAKMSQVTAGVFRFGPYAMFALLPVFALLLKIVYLGRRRRHPHRPRLYGEHLTYAAHNHAFVMFAIIAAFATRDFIRGAIVVWLLIYPLLCLRAVYGGSWFGVLARSFVIVVVYSVLFALAVAGLLIVAILVG